MKSVSLTAFPRSVSKRNQVKKLRASARVPAVIYGRLTKPQSLELIAKDLENLVHHSASENILVDLAVSGDARPIRLALVQEIQHHPLSGKALHVDFHEVAENELVTVSVPVESIGEALGVKASGGVLEHVLFKLKVRALPKDLPEYIEIDVSALDIGQSIHIGEITAPPGVEILGDKLIPVLAVAAPVTEAQEAEAAAVGGEAGKEPEMIKEKKEDGAEGAAPAKAADKGAEKAADKGEKKPAEKKK
jgi:large subunit ribosomal protein L25